MTEKSAQPPQERFDVLNENLGRLLLLSFRIFERSFQNYAAEMGYDDIRMSHIPILRNMRWEGSRTTEIAELAKLTKQTVGLMANELEAMNYIRRFPDPTDGRAKLVRYTKRGRDFMRDFPQILRRAEGDISRVIGEEHFVHLNELLVEVVMSFDVAGSLSLST